MLGVCRGYGSEIYPLHISQSIRVLQIKHGLVILIQLEITMRSFEVVTCRLAHNRVSKNVSSKLISNTTHLTHVWRAHVGQSALQSQIHFQIQI